MIIRGLIFAFLCATVIADAVSPLRYGGLVRQPTSGDVSGEALLLSTNLTFAPSPFYHGGPKHALIADASSRLELTGKVFPLDLRVYCVIDGRAVLPAEVPVSGEWKCDLSFLSLGGAHAAAAYAAHADGHGATLLGDVMYFSLKEPSPTESVAVQIDARKRLNTSDRVLRSATPGGVLGIYYTTYQQTVSQFYQNVSRDMGRPSVTIDDVVASDGALHFADSIWKYLPEFNASDPAAYESALFMSHEPALGIYCYYRRRANESSGLGGLADCPEASHVLQTHAAELSAAGFEFIAPDATNWDGDPRNASNGADLNQLRPTEIIAEEWAAMRLRGAATPQLSTFDRVNVGGVLWNWYLSEFFNNATLLELDLIMRNRNTSRVPGMDKVYIVADEPGLDWPAVRDIQANGGLEDVVTPIMWSAPDASGAYERNGYLKYFSPCTAVVNGSRVFSADVFLDLDAPCAHIKTFHSPVGDVWTVSSGLPVNSVPFGGARYHGLFLKKQFADVFADATPTDLLFAPSWNEFASDGHPMATWDMTNPLFYASGADATDPDRYTIVLDDFTSERSRTVEPSKQDGGYYYELFASCMRVYRLQAALGIVSAGASCDVAGEECCVVHADEHFVTVWSFEEAYHTGDSMLTSDADEARAIAARGWRELCAPVIDNCVPTAACHNESLVWPGGADIDAVRGPLLLYVNTSAALPRTAPLWRCVADGAPPTRHFVHGSPACPGGKPDTILGYGGAARDGLFSREVRRCRRAGASPPTWYSVANGQCGLGDADEGVVGYSI